MEHLRNRSVSSRNAKDLKDELDGAVPKKL